MFSILRIYKSSQPFKKINFLSNIFYRLYLFLNSCHVHPLCNLGNGITFVHGSIGVVINRGAGIGSNVRIYHNVTIGNDGKGGIPNIEKNVIIYSNSVVVGNICIGKNSVIGASPFVNKNVTPYIVWAGTLLSRFGH